MVLTTLHGLLTWHHFEIIIEEVRRDIEGEGRDAGRDKRRDAGRDKGRDGRRDKWRDGRRDAAESIEATS